MRFSIRGFNFWRRFSESTADGSEATYSTQQQSALGLNNSSCKIKSFRGVGW